MLMNLNQITSSKGMMRSILILTVAFLLFLQVDVKKTKNKSDKTRLYGSSDASDGQFPYAVMHILRSARAYHTCSGAIIRSDWVLLAAHCVNKNVAPTNHILVAGKADLSTYARARFRGMPFRQNINEATFDVQERRAASVHYHPQYNRGGSNDVGLIRVNRPFIFNTRVAQVPLSREAFTAREDCNLVGYGVVEENVRKYILQYISSMPARPARQCRYQRLRDVICLADTSRGICPGDSGGPLVCGGVTRGVASHGISREQGCGRGTVEQYYTDIERTSEWIETTLSGTQRNKNT